MARSMHVTRASPLPRVDMVTVNGLKSHTHKHQVCVRLETPFRVRSICISLQKNQARRQCTSMLILRNPYALFT